MADIRIKDLTTTASSTASGDFFVIDGTTGTRKVNAFNPSFGGNATVTGTLTVNGAGGSIGGQWKITNATIPDVWLQNTSGATSAYRNILIRQNSDDTFKFLSTSDAGVLSKDNILTGSNANGAIGIGVTPAAGASSLTVAGVIKTNDTTASTTTSTGALVVGNGTSGGLGVGGAGNFGGAVGVGGATVASRLHVYESTSGTGDSNGITIEQASTADAALQFLLTGTQRWTVGIDNSDSDKFKIGTGAIGSADRLTIDTSGNLSIPSTTASTSTSSGALVVSGGVGVAKNINAGDIIEVNFSGPIAFRGTSTNADCQLRLVNNSSGGREYHLSSSGTAAGAGAGFHVWDATANASALSIDASRNSTFGGSVKTSAPSGGTAAAWKLGTVASVSPTSPNRTIEVDIGGTIYYIHAKTTNN